MCVLLRPFHRGILTVPGSYMVDIDSWGMQSLVGSAPESFARVLGDFLLGYISSRAFLEVRFSASRRLSPKPRDIHTANDVNVLRPQGHRHS